MSHNGSDTVTFAEFALPKPLLQSLDMLKYTHPTPIQAQAIPVVLKGHDVLAQAQTGTGKTAAFALPILSKINTKQNYPQVLILAPTRELVAQICDALKKYAQNMPEVKIAAIYGGQAYRDQLRALKRGVHIIVGAPGRVMDHINRKTLDLSLLSCIVLDEADEMLKMGFVDDVEWICSHAPKESQKLLFSATMPKQIKLIANKYLKDPQTIKIAGKTSVENIKQSYWLIQGLNKLDALSRILETEETDGVIIFVKTKAATVEIADQLSQRGFTTHALNGDMTQEARESSIKLLKEHKLNIIVATDVAARGLDVERISHVINYDIPFNPEVYVHRIGRTGRAGRNGKAISFISHRDRNLLRNIERTTKHKIDTLTLPSQAQITQIRIDKFKNTITQAMQDKHMQTYKKIAADYLAEHNIDAVELCGALIKMAQGNKPLILEKESHQPKVRRFDKDERNKRSERKPRDGKRRSKENIFANFATFRIDVGHKHGVKPGNILGAIANEADLDRDSIGNISVFKNFSTVDLPQDLPQNTMRIIAKAKLKGKALNISAMVQ